MASTVSFSLAPNPKWYFVNMVGKPLGAGYFSTYSSLNKTQLKLVYEDPAGNFPWPYVQIPNVGTFGILIDENGTQGPFYFEFDTANPSDTYYLEVYDFNGVLQWTIDDFSPPSGGGGSVITENINLENLVTNNVMIDNIGASANPVGLTFLTLAPSAHSKLTLTPAEYGPDIVFIKNNTTAIDTLTFTPFTLGLTPFNPGDVTPTEYLNYTSNATTGETFKYVQFPIVPKVQNLSNSTVTVSIWARSNGSPQSITLQFVQFFGDGVGASPDQTTPIATINLTTSWAQYTFPGISISSVSGMTIGPCHNDGLFFQVLYPLDLACNIDFTKPSVYLGSIADIQNFQTYDVIESVTNAPRTGQVITSYNFTNGNYVPGGWIYMNDGTIGNPTSNATTRANFDTFPLFNLLWPISNLYCPMLSSAGAPVGRGSSAIADFSANNQMAIPKALGRVLSGADPSSIDFSKFFTVSGSSLIVDDSSPFYTGNPTAVTNVGGALPSPLVNTTVYYIIIINSTTIQLATSLANAENGIAITLTTTGSGTNSLRATIPAHPLASYVGEDTHATLVSQMPAHSHPPISGNGFEIEVNAGGTGNFISGTLTQLQATTGNTGGGLPHNNLQPTVYTNYLIKL